MECLDPVFAVRKHRDFDIELEQTRSDDPSKKHPGIAAADPKDNRDGQLGRRLDKAIERNRRIRRAKTGAERRDDVTGSAGWT